MSDLDKESKRDRSVNRGSYLIGDSPRPLDKKREGSKPETGKVPNEGELENVLASLKSMGIDPTKAPDNDEGQS